MWEEDAGFTPGAAWPERVAAAIAAMLGFAAANPNEVRALASQAVTQGAYDVARHRRLTLDLADLLEEGRRYRPDNGAALPAVTGEALAGGLMAIIGERVCLGEEASLPDLAPELVEFALTPYLGTEATFGLR